MKSTKAVPSIAASNAPSQEGPARVGNAMTQRAGYRDMDAVNTHQVFDWLWTSGQLSTRDIQRLPDLGVEAVVNLALPTSTHALPGEAEQVAGAGLAYVQIPVEWECPRPEQFVQFVGVLDAFQGRTIWVHCALNMRVSVFVYLYRRLVLSEDDSAASYPLREVWTPDATWQAFIDQALQTPPPAIE